MKRLAWVVGLLALVLSGGCGRQPEKQEKQDEAEGAPLAGFQVRTETLPAQTSTETRLIYLGKGKSALGLYIYDREGNCVAHDDQAVPSSKDDVTVSWFPKKGEVYTQELVNLGWSDNSYTTDRGPIGISQTLRHNFRLDSDSHQDVKIPVKGGRRACVFVEGDHDPVQPLKVEVLDAAGKLVTRDERDSDLCAVSWYPPEDARYTLRIHNLGKIPNIMTLVVK